MAAAWDVFQTRLLSSLVFAFQNGKSKFLQGIESWYPVYAFHCDEKRGRLQHGHIHLDDVHAEMGRRRDHIDAWIQRTRTCPSRIDETIRMHPPFGHVLEQYAAFFGDVALLELLYTMHVPKGFPLVHSLIDMAAFHGHVEILQLLSKVNYTGAVFIVFVSPVEIACLGGHLAFLQLLRAEYGVLPSDDQPKSKKPRTENKESLCTDFSERALSFAAKHGHVDVVEYICTVGGITTSPDALDQAAIEGHLPVVKFLTEKVPAITASTLAMDHAAAQGHLDLVAYLHSHRTEGCTSDAMDAAADNGHLDVVKFLHENRHEGCTPDAVDDAAAKGFTDIVRFLVLHRSEGGTAETLKAFAGRGDVDMVKWLHEHWKHGKWPVQAINAAATNGHTLVVKYLLDHQLVAYSPHALLGAAKHGHLAIVQHLLPKKPTKTCLAKAIQAALDGRHDAVASCLKDHICACCAKKSWSAETSNKKRRKKG